MSLWYRVFGRSDQPVPEESIRSALAASCPCLRLEAAPEHPPWLTLDIYFAHTTPLYLERFTVEDEGIRAELNSWAAFIETCDYQPGHAALMERMIQTQQLFTLRRPIDHADEVLVDKLCTTLCTFLAAATDGIWQADDQGIFAADGTRLLQEY